MKKVINNYNEVFVIKHKRRIWLYLIIIGIVTLVALTGVYVSRLISKVGTDVYVGAKTYYGVSMMQSDNVIELQAEYNSAVTLGGSGYIWQGKPNYLLALIYPEEDMANSVIATNSTTSFRLQLVELTSPEISYNLDGLSKEDKTRIIQSTNYLFDFANSLYELTIAMQKQSLSVVACASTINSHKGEIMALHNQVTRVLESYPNKDIDRLNTALTKAINLLDKMVVNMLDNTMDTINLKYGYCEYIRLLADY